MTRNEDGSIRTMTSAQFANALKRFPKVEQEFILHQRQVLGVDQPKEGR